MTAPRPGVLSVAALTSTETLDGGETVVVRFAAPDARKIALPLLRKEASDLKAASIGRSMRRGRTARTREPVPTRKMRQALNIG